ncbi:MAG: ribose 1,5-bisphosphate isomerase [Candidatus Methanomethylicia archaeon]
MKYSNEILRIADDIRTMRIRGATEIARSAAKAFIIFAESSTARNVDDYMDGLNEVSKILLNTRPTAVSLPNSIRFITYRVMEAYRKGIELKILKDITITSANLFIENSLKALDVIGELGARRIKDGDVLLTHCNSSAAISVIKTAYKHGKKIEVYVTETRPRFQGYLTAKTLSSIGVKVTLIIDSAVRHFMKDIDKVIVGADAVAANGAVVNKIGTSLIALAAHEARVRFFVAAETYKFSPETILGELIEIEERSPLEVVDNSFLRENINVKVKNPVFDVTPPEYIDLLITEKGVIPPQASILILREEFGWIIGETVTSRKIVEEDD